MSLIDDLYGQQAEIARQQAMAAEARAVEQASICHRLKAETALREAEQALAVVAAERAADRNVLIFRLALVLAVPAVFVLSRVL